MNQCFDYHYGIVRLEPATYIAMHVIQQGTIISIFYRIYQSFISEILKNVSSVLELVMNK